MTDQSSPGGLLWGVFLFENTSARAILFAFDFTFLFFSHDAISAGSGHISLDATLLSIKSRDLAQTELARLFTLLDPFHLIGSSTFGAASEGIARDESRHGD